MYRPVRNTQVPWIETLILNHDDEKAECTGRLTAYVTGVGSVSESQAGGSQGPAGLLFLSDGSVQIPAVLTAAAWERLQEEEERERVTGLDNVIVVITRYRTRFHMDAELNRCRFLLSVEQLVTKPAGPDQVQTPHCTSLPSVRHKISQTWKAQLAQGLGSQLSQDESDLSELLGVWEHECVEELLQEVQKLLGSLGPPRDPCAATGWDLDRVRYKEEEPLSIPVRFVLMPEEEEEEETPEGLQHTRTPQGIRAPDVLSAPHSHESWPGPGDSVPHEDSVLHGDTVAGMISSDSTHLSNPWDMFRPPCDSVSSSLSPAGSPPFPLTPSVGAQPCVAVLTSTQIREDRPAALQTSEPSRELSFLPPYQRPHPCPPSTSAHPPEASSCSAATDADQTPPHLPASDGDHQAPGVQVKRSGKAKRKRCDPAPEEEEAGVGESPPSWLFETSGSEGGSSQTPSIHSNGTAISSSFQVTGQNLQDFSRFRVPDVLLHWAVRYLLPEPPVEPQQRPAHTHRSSSDLLDG
ncbi:adrenocortical dysplasia protein homolog [Genypterus blacodes]|uniref:adrenocortical dysplasia protein homolog n=1 Tax=Genypterus blacodes TaxID=154954 RepID=UPI003F769897